jgi:fatty acid-binding protein DegV
VSIAVVTDSTAYLPSGYAARYGVRVVPLHVSVNGGKHVYETEFSPRDLAEALENKHRVTTASATSGELARA